MRKGNLWGLPVNLILFSLVAGITTIVAFKVYGEVLLHPEQISAKFDSWLLALLAALTFAVATLGIILVDYYLIARGEINVAVLYQEDGEYRHQGGWNVNALIAAAVGAIFFSVLPSLTTLLPSWSGTYGWFFGVALGGVVYYALSAVRPLAVST